MSGLLSDDQPPELEAGEGRASIEGMDPTIGLAAQRRSQEIQKRMAPPGSLGLPPLLEKRRIQYGLIDAFFERQMIYDRILLYQIDQFGTVDGRVSEDSPIIAPDIVQARNKNEASRGILVNAGLGALDALTSNGCELGDIVEFVRLTPWSIKLDYFAGQTEWGVVMRAGDLVNSMDLAGRLKRGECKVVWDEEHGQHQIKTPDGKMWHPTMPHIAGEY